MLPLGSLWVDSSQIIDVHYKPCLLTAHHILHQLSVDSITILQFKTINKVKHKKIGEEKNLVSHVIVQKLSVLSLSISNSLIYIDCSHVFKFDSKFKRNKTLIVKFNS